MSTQNDSLIDKINRLPRERVAEVEDFVDFIAQRASRLAPTRDEQIAAYAAKHGGSLFDLDEELETAAAEHLRMETIGESQRRALRSSYEVNRLWNLNLLPL